MLGRKTGKGCYVYSGKKGKDRSVNTDAEALLEKYRMPINGRSVNMCMCIYVTMYVCIAMM